MTPWSHDEIKMGKSFLRYFVLLLHFLILANTLSTRKSIADINLNIKRGNIERLSDAPYVSFIPNTPAQSFSVPTLKGVFHFDANQTKYAPVIVSIFSKYSGFLQCFWNCSNSIDDLIIYSTNSSRYLFISRESSAYEEATWMSARFEKTVHSLTVNKRISKEYGVHFLNRVDFVTISLEESGTWLPEVLAQWACLDHNCGYDQAVFTMPGIRGGTLVSPRLDARYDWLPSFPSKFGGQTLTCSFYPHSCDATAVANLTGQIAVVINSTCSYAKQIENAQQHGALGVVVMETDGGVKDVQCAGVECDLDLHIPATSVPFNKLLLNASRVPVRFQNTPSSNFFLAIDQRGNLQEVGWLLYPSMRFLAWQAEWFEYMSSLERRLNATNGVITLWPQTTMQGAKGVSRSISLPDYQDLVRYSRLELDLSLDCPGSLDHDCPQWDHTVSLTVCALPEICGFELGRWITAFRRRVGRWLTDVTQLLPLLSAPEVSKMATFKMATAPWALPWQPALNLRLSGRRNKGDLYPASILPLYNSDGVIFDRNYNSHFPPIKFNVSGDVVKVELFAVITGHGSDEHGCGEFCVTSHTFTVNGHNYTRSFDSAGSPLGCAEQVGAGSEPNEHGTWLYGRGGWCDGMLVRPWLSDVTEHVLMTTQHVTSPSQHMTSPQSQHVTSQSQHLTSQQSKHVITPLRSVNNVLSYRGTFQGRDPDPKSNPGVMIFASYLVFYKEL